MKPWRIYAALVAIVVVFGGGLLLGWRLFRPVESTRTVNAQVILTALRDRGFLVTQTYVFDQPVTIEKTSGSAFKDFFFGQTITARGAMEVNLGIDLAKVSESDIAVDGDTITVTVPAASLFNVRLLGPIDVENKQGILKRVLQNEDGYNEALTELSKIAEETATSSEFMTRATDRAKEEVSRLVGYVAQGKTVNVVVR
ncbi:MAG: DUF4230 domain-containing protein [Patescibacteria group bacterium]